MSAGELFGCGDAVGQCNDDQVVSDLNLGVATWDKGGAIVLYATDDDRTMDLESGECLADGGALWADLEVDGFGLRPRDGDGRMDHPTPNEAKDLVGGRKARTYRCVDTRTTEQTNQVGICETGNDLSGAERPSHQAAKQVLAIPTR